MRRYLAGAIVAGFAVTAALVAYSPDAGPANASNWSGASGVSGCGGVNRADNAAHYFWYADLSGHMTNAVDWARSNDIDPTDITTYDDGALDAQTDVVVRDDYYVDYCGVDWYTAEVGGVIGLTTCDSVNAARECEKHTIRFSNTYTRYAETTERRGLACHENGHALGLLHSTANTSCMRSADPTPAQDYDAHDVAHINGNY